MPFTFGKRFRNLLGFAALQGDDDPLDAINTRARHVDGVFVKRDFGLVGKLQLFVDRSLSFLFGLAFGQQGGLLRHRFF